MQKILKKILKIMSQVILKRYHPQIIGITGSVGKTSTREAVFEVLHSHYSVWRSAHNFNNEIGVPLTILGINRNISWINFPWISLKWLIMLLWWPYPKVLILEMAVDHPRDMDYFLNFIKVDLAILTDISESHLKFFQNKNQLAKEKVKLIQSTIQEQGSIIVNIDNPRIKKELEEIRKQFFNAKEKENLEKRIFTYGIKNEAKIRATDIHFYVSNNTMGLSFKLNFQDKSIPVRLKKIIAPHQIYAVLAGIATGVYFKLDLMEIINKLEKNFFSPEGRMQLKKGNHNILIINDTYNASPVSVLASLEALETISKTLFRRRVVVLGDMLELGKFSPEGHRKVLNKVRKLNLDLILLVGSRMKKAASQLFSSQASKNCFCFENVTELNNKINNLVQANDLVLIKGSRAIQLDKTVKLLAVDNSD